MITLDKKTVDTIMSGAYYLMCWGIIVYFVAVTFVRIIDHLTTFTVGIQDYLIVGTTLVGVWLYFAITLHRTSFRLFKEENATHVGTV